MEPAAFATVDAMHGDDTSENHEFTQLYYHHQPITCNDSYLFLKIFIGFLMIIFQLLRQDPTGYAAHRQWCCAEARGDGTRRQGCALLQRACQYGQKAIASDNSFSASISQKNDHLQVVMGWLKRRLGYFVLLKRSAIQKGFLSSLEWTVES
ncbi:hypothetical protein BC829DRAFT_380126 [Chytridium lagenaria]|nr:hypothetical protein BC829DRAFT_380126 [Chytridium lagenaria]